MSIRTRTVLAPDTDRRQVPTSNSAVVEELVECTPERAPARVHLGPRLPDMIIGVLERLLRYDGPVPEERATLGSPETLVVDLQ